MQRLEKLLFGSRNPAKHTYYSGLLSRLATEVLFPEQAGVEGRPEETGSRAEANAEIKARFYAERCGFHALAEDEMLLVDFLPPGEQPGVLGRRIDGEREAPDDELLQYWAELLTQVPEPDRTGRWHVAYCLASPDGDTRTFVLDHPVRFFLPPSETRIEGWPLSSIQGRVAFGRPGADEAILQGLLGS
jgi:XTP/dITP diphosphohydrolase